MCPFQIGRDRNLIRGTIFKHLPFQVAGIATMDPDGRHPLLTDGLPTAPRKGKQQPLMGTPPPLRATRRTASLRGRSPESAPPASASAAAAGCSRAPPAA